MKEYDETTDDDLLCKLSVSKNGNGSNSSLVQSVRARIHRQFQAIDRKMRHAIHLQQKVEENHGKFDE